MPLLETRGSGSAIGYGLNSTSGFPFDISGIRTSNLQVALGPGGNSYKPSLPNDWFDISGNGNHFKISPSAYKIDAITKVPYFDFGGNHGLAKTASTIDVPGWTDTSSATVITFTRILTSNGDWRTLLRTRDNDNSVGNATRHNVIVQTGAHALGMYNNNNSTAPSPSGLITTDYNVTSFPGYGTSTWIMCIWRYQDAANLYYNFSYNDSPGTIRGNVNQRAALFMKGPHAIGGYGANPNFLNDPTGGNSQYWGDISNIFMWNARLSDAECLQVWNKYKGYYGL